MSVIGIYCEECGNLIGAEDTSTGEREYHGRWCGIDGKEKCWGCCNPFNIEVEEWDDEPIG